MDQRHSLIMEGRKVWFIQNLQNGSGNVKMAPFL